MGIDLPVRYVAYEDERGVVHVGRADIAVLADRHGATGVDETPAMVQSATDAHRNRRRFLNERRPCPGHDSSAGPRTGSTASSGCATPG